MALKRQTDFSAGELAPGFFGRFELEQFSAGIEKGQNCFVSRTGSIRNRAGLVHVGTTKNVGPTILRRFDFSDDQNYAIEFGDKYLRMFTAAGAPVTFSRVPTVMLSSHPWSQAYGGIFKSLDGGLTWARKTTGISGIPNMFATNGSRIVGIGDYSLPNSGWYSDDAGETWTACTGLPGGTTFRKVLHTGSRFVAWDGKNVATSSDGATFAAAAGLPGTDFQSISSDGSGTLLGFYITGTTLTTYRSTDNGQNWSLRSNVTVNDDVMIVPERESTLTAVFAGGYHYIALFSATTAHIYRSTDGLAWARVTSTPCPNMGVGNPSPGAMFAVNSTQIMFAMSSRPPIVTSINDGTIWLSGSAVVGWQIAGTPSGFSAIQGTTRWTTADGLLWVSTKLLMQNSNVFIEADAWSIPFAGSNITNSELTTQWPAADLQKLRFTQSGDVIFVTHPNYPPVRLVRTGGTVTNPKFELLGLFPPAPVAKVSGIAQSGASGAVDAAHPTKSWSWVATWVDSEDVESLPSAAFTLSCPLYPDRPISLTWPAVAGAVRYNVYRGRNGDYGYVGTVAQPSSGTVLFADDGQQPLLTHVPPSWSNPFETAYPAVSAFFQDRFVLGNTKAKPGTLFTSRSGDYNNYDKGLVLKDEDGLLITLASRRYEEIRALVSMRELLALTSENEWSISGSGGDPLSYRSIDAKQHSTNGSSWIDPLIVLNECFYVQTDKRTIRNLVFDVNSDSYRSQNMTLLAEHLFLYSSIVDWAYCHHPNSSIWVVRADGVACSMTYIPELKIWAWTSHDFGGVVETVCSINDGVEDNPWFVVNRGGTRYIERLASRTLSALADGVFLDRSIVAVAGGAGAYVTAVAHMSNGDTVYATVNGVLRGPFTISGGLVDIGTVAFGDKIVIGKKYTGRVITLDDPDAKMRKKNCPRVFVERSKVFDLSGTGGGLYAGEPGVATTKRPFTSDDDGNTEILIDSSWNWGGRVEVKWDDPVPLEITAVIRDMADVGG